MQQHLPKKNALRLALILMALLAVALLFRDLIARLLSLAVGGASLAFLALPMARLCERKMSRGAAAATVLFALAATLLAGLILLVPILVRELAGLSRELPRSLAALNAWMHRLSAVFSRRLPGIAVPSIDLQRLTSSLPGLLPGAAALVSGATDVVGRLSMMILLAGLFLRDRERYSLRAELIIPQSVRPMAVRMGTAAVRELRLYLRAQLLIAFAVAAVSTAGLILLGVRSALALGPLIGLLNMIPYVGPFIGGLPAVLIALGDSLEKALLTAALLILVQQLDGAVLSPRIMGSVTGLPPALMLVALFASAQLWGVAGMLFAVPTLILFRTIYRVYVQRTENI